jgi:hypothetical protein
MGLTIVNRIVPTFPWNPRVALDGVVIHDTAGSSTALQEASRLQSQSQFQNGIAHWYVDGSHAVQLVDERNSAWHLGVWVHNQRTIGIEVCRSMGTPESVYRESLANAIILASQICKRYGLNPNTNISVIRNHNEFIATACPHRSIEIFGGRSQALNMHRTMVRNQFNGSSDVMRQNFNNVHTRVRLTKDRGVFFLPNERRLYTASAGTEMIVHYEAVMINGFAWNKCSIILESGRIDSRWVNLQREDGSGKTYTIIADPFQWYLGTSDCSTQNAEISRLNRNITNAITSLQAK